MFGGMGMVYLPGPSGESTEQGDIQLGVPLLVWGCFYTNA